MGAGASAASPQDVALLNDCINSIKDSFDEEVTVLVDKQKTTFLADLPPERLSLILPVLEASTSKYCRERKNNLNHPEAHELALDAGRSIFSASRKTLPAISSLEKKPSTQEIINIAKDETTSSPPLDPTVGLSTGASSTNDFKPLAASEPSPIDSGRFGSDEDKKKWRAPKGGRSKGRRKHRPNPIPQAKLLISGICSQYEEAEIGGGTMYTTEISLYEDGTIELGNHDIGQRGRQVHRRARGGGDESDNSFSDALFWGGYEYYTGSWVVSKEVKDVNFDVDVSNKACDLGHRFDISLNKVNTQPSDPYSSMRTEREITASLVLTTEMPLVVDQDSSGVVDGASNGGGDGDHGSLILSNIEGELSVKFKELKQGMALMESFSESFTE